MRKISASNGQFKLRSRDYTRVEISEDVSFQTGEFNPCTELGGKTAKITLVTVSGKNDGGEIQSMEVVAAINAPVSHPPATRFVLLLFRFLINHFPTNDGHDHRHS